MSRSDFESKKVQRQRDQKWHTGRHFIMCLRNAWTYFNETCQSDSITRAAWHWQHSEGHSFNGRGHRQLCWRRHTDRWFSVADRLVSSSCDFVMTESWRWMCTALSMLHISYEYLHRETTSPIASKKLVCCQLLRFNIPVSNNYVTFVVLYICLELIHQSLLCSWML